MKIRRKIYAVLLTAALILTLLPAMAFAEGEEGVEPVDAWFSGILWADVGDTDVNGMYLTKDGSSAIDVRYTDDITVNPVTFTYIEQEIKDEYGDTMLRCGFLRDGADPDKDESYAYAFIDYENLSPIAAGANEIPIIISVPYIDPDTGDLEYKEFNTTYHMWVSVERPLSVDFIPAPGFTLKGAVGYNFLNEEDFYGEGNKFRVSIEEPVDPEVFPDDPSPMVITVDYTYVKTEDADNRLTRGELARIYIYLYADEYYSAAEVKGIYKAPYSDVKETNPYVGYITFAKYSKITDAKDKFEPNKTFKKGDCIKMAYDYLAGDNDKLDLYEIVKI